jgi:hypothetical protein
MGTKVYDYHPWAAAAVLYALADGAERLAGVRQTVASVLRTLGGVRERGWPATRAAQLEREAAEYRRSAARIRVRARRVSGVLPWRSGHPGVPAE